MGKKASNPRSGSMQFWPRVKAKGIVARVRGFPQGKEPKLVGFAGIKAGMTHVTYEETRKEARFSGETVATAATIVECPALKILSVRFYNKDAYGLQVAKDILNPKLDSVLKRTIAMPKKEADMSSVNVADYDDVRVLVYTQPKLTGIGQKKPNVFEMALGNGSVEDKFNFVKENLDKEISVADVFKEGEFVDAHAITTGKGVQGVIKRFGVGRKQAKSEKGTRRVGTICGGWKAQAHMMYRVPQAGKMGFHTRTAYNLKILKISDNVDEINVKGGLLHYGDVKTTYMLVKGSVPGPKKRLIKFVAATRPGHKANTAPVALTYVSQESQQ